MPDTAPSMQRRALVTALLSAMLSPARAARSGYELADFLRSATSPEAYLLELFRRCDLVLLAEDHAVRDVLEFVASLIPALHAAGVHTLGMEFGAAERQVELDALVTGASYDAQAARDMMFFYNVGWAYREYAEIYRAAWSFNETLRPAGTPPFRILNLSYRYDWSAMRGARTPASMRRVFWKGPPDRYRAEVVEREVLAKGEKALLLVGRPHAHTRFASPYLSTNADDFCGHDEGGLGNRLYRRAPRRVASVLVHQPLPTVAGSTPTLVLPGGTSIERELAALGRRRAGFDLVGTPAGRLADRSAHALCDPTLSLEQVFDGYVFLAPIRQLRGCTIDEGFFDGRRWEEIRAQIPDPDWRGNVPTLDAFWSQIRDYVDLDKRYAGLR